MLKRIIRKGTPELIEKIVVGGNESEIMKMINQIPKEA